jgi:hypothetical protein
MPRGRNEGLRGFAASVLLAASLTATPVSAQTGGGGDDGYGYGPGQPCSPWGGNYGYLECCYYPGQGWYYYYNVVGGGDCPYYQSPDEPADRPSQEPTESPGQ